MNFISLSLWTIIFSNRQHILLRSSLDNELKFENHSDEIQSIFLWEKGKIVSWANRELSETRNTTKNLVFQSHTSSSIPTSFINFSSSPTPSSEFPSRSLSSAIRLSLKKMAYKNPNHSLQKNTLFHFAFWVQI